MSRDNGPDDGKRVNRAEEWWRYDALTPDKRRVYQLAPYKMWIRPASWSRERLVEEFLAIRDRKIAKAYGKDHPQIGTRTPERRPIGKACSIHATRVSHIQENGS